jgi:nucleotide-binding universal stress UspA family protein
MMTDDSFPESPYKRVLFCTDFSPNADLAFDYALDAVRRRPGAVLYVFHVIPEPGAQFWKTYLAELDDLDAKARQDVDEKIAATYLPRVPEGMDLQVEVRIGRDYVEILKFAAATKVDLIVLGRRGHSTLGEALFGSVAEKIVRRAHCAVLVVPHED